MIKDEITAEQVKEMSQEELFLLGEKFAKERQAEEIQKILINYLEADRVEALKETRLIT